MSNALGGIVNWEVLHYCTVGSDHFPIITSIGDNGRKKERKKVKEKQENGSMRKRTGKILFRCVRKD